jgi:hypothetical protein
MASGTLVPFMSEVGLPGDSFDIDLDVDVKTLPTVGPLFGSYKVQLDVFQCPIRLYNGKLHMNMLNIGMDMSQILLPQVEQKAIYEPNGGDNSQINSSSIYSYLNMRGLGKTSNNVQNYITRYFNAIPYLGYWDIYKNYYANKQEERGFVIHANDLSNAFTLESAIFTVDGVVSAQSDDIYDNETTFDTSAQGSGAELPIVTCRIELLWSNAGAPYGAVDVNDINIEIDGTTTKAVNVFANVSETVIENDNSYYVECSVYTGIRGSFGYEVNTGTVLNTLPAGEGQPQLTEFPLDNIDEMRMDILEAVRNTTAFTIDNNSASPYGLGS